MKQKCGITGFQEVPCISMIVVDRIMINCKDIILEAQHVNYNEGAPKFDEVKEYLQSIGFELKAEITRNNIDGDYHFTRK